MAGEMTSSEKRIKVLESQILALRDAVTSLAHKAGATTENTDRQADNQGLGGGVLFRMQSVGVIPASGGATLGSGTARFIQVIGGTRYLTQPFAAGDVTTTCYNDTGGPTIDNEYMICAYVDGLCTGLVADCATASPTRAADPPA